MFEYDVYISGLKRRLANRSKSVRHVFRETVDEIDNHIVITAELWEACQIHNFELEKSKLRTKQTI